MKYEYKILNMSEITAARKKDPKVNFLTFLNDLGKEGWKMLFPLKEQSYLMIRELDQHV